MIVMTNDGSKRKGTQRSSQRTLREILCVPSRIPLRPLRLNLFMKRAFIFALVFVFAMGAAIAQTRRRKPASKPATQQAPKGSATKYSAFIHSSDKHKSLTCNSCHKVPTNWTAKRAFPDVADFPNHDACVRCHRQQFFTRQAMAGLGPIICTVCHVRASPRDDARFAFGKPNGASQAARPKDERQFIIEFPHDKHQNVIASRRLDRRSEKPSGFIRASFFESPDDQQKPDYNNCSICHQPNDQINIAPVTRSADASAQVNRFFKTTPHSHDSCFNCHWKNQQPVGDDCAGCHKAVPAFAATPALKRTSAMFSHEGGKGEHVLECTTCHINISRAGTLRGLTPDVPIAACATCHKDNKKTTYPKIITIEDELAQFKQTNNCAYCHTPDVGKKTPPASHGAAVQ